MKPLIRLKHYSRHVVSYITGIWEHHPGATKSLDNRVLYPSHFFAIFDAMFSESSSNISKDLQKEFQSVFPLVKAASIGDCSLDHELFPRSDTVAFFLLLFCKKIIDLPGGQINHPSLGMIYFSSFLLATYC